MDYEHSTTHGLKFEPETESLQPEAESTKKLASLSLFNQLRQRRRRSQELRRISDASKDFIEPELLYALQRGMSGVMHVTSPEAPRYGTPGTMASADLRPADSQ